MITLVKNTSSVEHINVNVNHDQGVSIVLLNHQGGPRVTLASVFSCTDQHDHNGYLGVELFFRSFVFF